MSLLAGPTIMLCNVFSVYTPTHRCYIPDIDDNPNRTEQHEALPEVPQEYVYMQVNKSVVVLSNEIYGNGSGADLCWALGGGIICNFTPIWPYFQHWRGWSSTYIFFT